MRAVLLPVASLLLLAVTTLASAQDINGNLAADSKGLRLGTSVDCNANGIPDDAETDRPHFSAAVEHLNALEEGMSNVFDACPIDFNADGQPDVVTLSMPDPNKGYVTLWRNDGGVGLSYVSRITMLNARPAFALAADVNADGFADLVLADSSYTKIYILQGNGDATFASPVTLTGSASNNGLSGLAIGDIDNDGDIDIAATGWSVHTVYVWKNSGDGTFASPVSVGTGFAPRGIAMGDLTGDGVPDLATANSFETGAPSGSNGTVTIIENTAGGFVAQTAITMPTNTGPFGIMRPKPQDLVVCDVDHDGDSDLVVSSKESQRLDLVRNNGDGTFAAPALIDAGYYIGSAAGRLLCRDLNGDGWEEIAWCDTKAYSVNVYANDAGTFTFHQSYATGHLGSVSVDAADFNGDRLPELVIANDGLRTFSVLKNLGELFFDATLRFRPSQYPAPTVIADFTNDGITDLGFNDQSTTSVLGFFVYPGLGNARFGTAIATPAVNQSGIIRAHDLNHDGNQDLLITSGQCRVHLGNGDGTFQAPIDNPPSVSFRAIVDDINVDGHLDIVWVYGGHPGTLFRSLGDGTGHFGPTLVVGVVPAEDQSIASGDITGDGFPEIFTGHAQGLTQPGGVLSIYPNNGDGTFGTRDDRYIVGQPLSPKVAAIAVADFDIDGDNDVTISANGLKMFTNPGDGALPETGVQVAPQGGSILLVADIDLDTIPDLYVRSSVGAAFLNDGTGHFTRRMFMHFYDSSAHGMIIGDLNNDGRTDLVIDPENSWDKYAWLNLPPVSDDCDGDGTLDACDPDICGGNGVLGDLNGDAAVDASDLAILLAGWGACASSPCIADIDGDGAVTGADLAIVLSAWGA